MRPLLSFAATTAVLAATTLASADVTPLGIRSPDYTLTISNLKDHKDHVFIVYPTTNNGFGYVLEEGKGLSNLMMNGRRGLVSRLYAMTRAEFDKQYPSPNRYPHGDNDAMVTVVPAPPGPPAALMSSAPIEPPEAVPESSPTVRIEKVFRIRRLDAQVFDLVQTHETVVTRGGKRRTRALPEPPPPVVTAAAAPTSTGIPTVVFRPLGSASAAPPNNELAAPAQSSPAQPAPSAPAPTTASPPASNAAAPGPASSATGPTVEPVPKGGGCAGCETGAGSPGSLGLVLAMVLGGLICLRHERRR